MIIRAVHGPILATDLPRYFGTLAATDEIVGVGRDSIFVIDDSLKIITYREALQTGRVADVSVRMGSASFGYSETLRELAALAKAAPESDELGRARPSERAIQVASELAFRMLRSAAGMQPPSDVSIDRDGDIRIVWENGDRTLELVCPYEPSQRAYIFYSDDNEYTIAYDLSVYRLGRLLAWLGDAIPVFPR